MHSAQRSNFCNVDCKCGSLIWEDADRSCGSLYNRGNTLLRQSGCYLKIKHPEVACASDCVAIDLAIMSHLERLYTKPSQQVKDLAASKPELGPE